MLNLISKILHVMTRKKIVVEIGNVRTTTPVSKVFGTDRGTPIDRYYIEHFLQAHAEQIQGRILEVGEPCYARKFSRDKYHRIDVIHPVHGVESATITGDLTELDSLPAAAFDCFICTQTFNFIMEVQKAVVGAHHLLKPGGVLLATVAGISQISRYDMELWGDYWRFTTLSVERLFRPLFGPDLAIECHGNALAACAFLQGLAVEDLPEPSLLQDTDPDYQLIITIVARKGR